ELLDRNPNVSLQSWAENNLLALAIVASDFDAALKHGEKALKYADESSSPHERRDCLANLGNLYLAKGEFGQAEEFLLNASKCLPCVGEAGSAIFESRARAQLYQGKLADCGALLDEIASLGSTLRDRAAYVYRYSQLTRTRLLLAQHSFDAALS